MNKPLLKKLSNLPTFSINTVRSLFNGDEKATNQWIWRQIEKGTLISLKKGLYTTIEYKKANNTQEFIEYISSIIKYPSYLSTTYVLSKYDMLTDLTYGLSSITTKMGRMYANKLGNYSYQTVQKKLFTGYTSEYFQSNKYYIATKSKALFDYLYLKKSLTTELTKKFSIAEEFRIRIEEMNDTDWKEFATYIKLTSKSKNRMTLIFKNICKNASDYL